MSKLPADKRFFDLSDYGRPFAKALVSSLVSTPVTSIHLTFAFLAAGVLAIWCIWEGHFAWAAFFLMVKNILDAADGEMARRKNQPSYTGRYLDSIFDFLINAGICVVLFLVTKCAWPLALLAFLGLQFQCAICNYYYVIQRNRMNGDMTSRIVEYHSPTAFPYERQATVNCLHGLFMLLYGSFDGLVLKLDKDAFKIKEFPKWFLTLSSSLMLGFQLAIIAALFLLGQEAWVLPVFAGYSIWGLLVIGVRKWMVGND